MTSFPWKRKAGGKILKSVSKAFEENSKDASELDPDVDWISLAPKRKVIHLEDASIKSSRLKQEGATLAEADRFWEAILKWDEALQLTPSDETLYEMKSQAFLQLSEVYPAVKAARKCVELNPRWWVGFQTLGRAQLALGEVKLALRSFSVAFHLNPGDEELFHDDLNWVVELLRRKALTELEQKISTSHEEEGPKIIEIDTDDENLDEKSTEDDLVGSSVSGCELPVSDRLGKSLKRIPSNYVFMRST